MTPRRNDLKALRNMIAEANLILSTTELPEGRSQRAQELLSAAVSLADLLLETKPAAVLGKVGGQKTAERGPDYYRKIAAMRKENKGGRPPKQER
jgi:hypothetical protein